MLSKKESMFQLVILIRIIYSSPSLIPTVMMIISTVVMMDVIRCVKEREDSYPFNQLVHKENQHTLRYADPLTTLE